MKLLFIIPEYPPHSGGGIATFYRDILSKISDQGHLVNILVGIGKKPLSFGDLPNELFFEVDENDIRGSINRLFEIPYKDLEFMANGYRQWMRINRNPEYLNRLLFLQLKGVFNG
jgi:hypothetical protein